MATFSRLSEAFSSFSVDDLEKAQKFYLEKLGIKVNKVEPGYLDLQFGEGKHIMVYGKDNHEPATFTVLNFPVDNIEKKVDELNDLGVRFEHYEGDLQTNEKGILDWENGPKMAWFKDPAGNIFSLMEMG